MMPHMMLAGILLMTLCWSILYGITKSKLWATGILILAIHLVRTFM